MMGEIKFGCSFFSLGKRIELVDLKNMLGFGNALKTLLGFGMDLKNPLGLGINLKSLLILDMVRIKDVLTLSTINFINFIIKKEN
jgi:hypothetical protein